MLSGSRRRINLEYQYISTQKVACHNPEQRERQVPWNFDIKKLINFFPIPYHSFSADM
jgi:hypothetical protein